MDIENVNSNSQPTPVPAKAGSCGLGRGEPLDPKSRSQNLTREQAIEIRSGLEKVVGMKSESGTYRKTRVLKTLVKEEAYQAIVHAAEEAGVTLSDYLRALLAAPPVGLRPRPKVNPATPKADPILIRQVASMGNNLNQVARWCNAHAEATASEKAKVLLELIAIRQALEAICISSI
jgi:hypothetical protein